MPTRSMQIARKQRLLYSTPQRQKDPTEAMAEATLGVERSNDITDEQVTGIERIRFFKKDDRFRGLHEVLSTAFGGSIAPPQVETIW